MNPIVFGLGDLRASEAAGAAREIGATARREQTYVAADNEFVSALMVGNGVPMITGWQISGPDRDAWEALDPDGSEEELWNRGASYLRMSFTGAPGSAPAISTPNPDIVLITVNPCGIPDELDVGLIVSSSRLEAECLQPRRTFTWSGQKRHVYAVLD